MIEATRRTRTSVVAVTVSFFVVEWLLFELMRIPYRPPVDMLTLLGTEKYFVVLVIAVLACVWLGMVIYWATQFRFQASDYAGFAAILSLVVATLALVAIYPPWVVTPFHLMFR